MIDLTDSTGSRFEIAGSYARGRRVGDHVYVSGSGAVDRDGAIQHPGDMHGQAIYTFAKIAATLERLGASMADVVRTRAYFADIASAEDYVRAHGETFAGILPAATGVEARLGVPGMLVEIDVDAIVRPPA